jgi:hypothetical protein
MMTTPPRFNMAGEKNLAWEMDEEGARHGSREIFPTRRQYIHSNQADGSASVPWAVTGECLARRRQGKSRSCHVALEIFPMIPRQAARGSLDEIKMAVTPPFLPTRQAAGSEEELT